MSWRIICPSRKKLYYPGNRSPLLGWSWMYDSAWHLCSVSSQSDFDEQLPSGPLLDTYHWREANFCCIKLLWFWFIISAQHRPPRLGHPRGLWSSRPRLSCSSKGCSFTLLTCSNYSALWPAFLPQMRSRLTSTQLLPDLCSNLTFYVRLTLNTPSLADTARRHPQTLQILLYIMSTFLYMF